MDNIEKIKAAMLALLSRDQRNTCQHEETHRGGAIWEICDSCGAKWSDDRNPKPEWVDPPEWDATYVAIALLNGISSESSPKSVNHELRDYFAATALQTLDDAIVVNDEHREMIAKRSYQMADAMLKARG